MASSCGFCCFMETSFVTDASIGYRITPFAVMIASIACLSVLFIFARIFNSIREDHFSLYLSFCLMSAFTLFLATVQRLLPVSASPNKGYAIGLDVALVVLISLQWFVQTGAVIFLFERNPGQYSVRRVVVMSLLFSATLLVPWVVSIALGTPFIGEMVDEALLIFFFVTSLLLLSPSFRQCINIRDFYLQPRPALLYWSSFMAVFHTLFFIMYAVRGFNPGSEAGSCMYIIVDTSYYLLYAPLLMFVVKRDSRYWSEHGALLLDMQTVLDTTDVDEKPHKHHVAGIPLIRWDQLVFKEKLGSGAFSEVYRAKWDSSIVAVKVLRVARGQLETMEQLLREARLMHALRHPNVLQLLGISMRGRRQNTNAQDETDTYAETDSLLDDSDRAPINMEMDVLLCAVLRFCPGGSLFTYLHNDCNNALTIPMMVRIAKGIAEGMAYLHANNIMHRDLKSPNVLLDADSNAVISDFGLSRPDVHGTATMSAIGTPLWMAPEVLRGDRYGFPADVWAFGIILWELAERKVPYTGMTGIAVMQQVGFENRKLAVSDENHVLAQLVQVCLASDPKDRPSFEEITKRL